MEEIGEFCRKASLARFRPSAAIDFSHQLRNEFSRRHFDRAAKKLRCDQLIPWFFQAKTGHHFAELRQIRRAERQKLALHENQRQATGRPAFARFATRSSQQELKKPAIVTGVDKELACEPQNGVSICKVPL